MSTTNEHLIRLRKAIEEKTGKKAESPADFNFIALQIKKEIGESVSLSTMKRIWGYVAYNSQPSKLTLSIMARFLGYPDWSSFCSHTESSPFVESEDLSDKVINAADIMPGTIIEITWRPNRYCKLECIGKKQFRVLESQNSKLFPGNIFKAELFGQGLPFYVTELQQNYNEGRIYVAGEHHGLTSIKVNNQSKINYQ